MANKQLFAKLGVFVLLACNVAAYWFFWPNYRSGVTKASTQDKGEPRLVPGTVEVVEGVNAKPREMPPASLSSAVPLSIPTPPVQPNEDPLGRLLDHINKEKGAKPEPVAVEQKRDAILAPPPDLGKPGELKIPVPEPIDPGKLPPLKPISILPPNNDGVTLAVHVKGSESPWLLRRPEAIGNRTQFAVQLQPVGASKPLAEFHIICDRVDSKPMQQQIQAIGNVVFTSGGLRGECQSATLRLLEPVLILEGNVLITDPSAPGHGYRSDRVIWSPNAPPRAVDSAIRPALGLPNSVQ